MCSIQDLQKIRVKVDELFFQKLFYIKKKKNKEKDSHRVAKPSIVPSPRLELQMNLTCDHIVLY